MITAIKVVKKNPAVCVLVCAPHPSPQIVFKIRCNHKS